MALTAVQLAELVTKAKVFMRIGDDDDAFKADAFTVYNDESDSATTCTVAVTGGVVTIVVAGGANAGTYEYDTSTTAYDTIAEVVAAINAADKGNVATLIGKSDADATLLYRLAPVSCFGQANEQALQVENNELLELLITNVFDALETELGRDILSTSYTELFDAPAGTKMIELNHPQVSQVTMVSADLEDGLRVKYTGTGTHARVEVTDTAVICTSRLAGTTTTTETAFSSQASTALMATTINALSGWSASVVNSRPSGFLVRQGVRDCKDTEVTLQVWDDMDAGYEVDYPAGTIEFPWGVCADRGKVLIAYTAGYSSLPADLELVLLSLIKGIWDGVRKDAAVSEEKLGDYSYKLAKQAGSIDWSAHARTLANYRRVTL